MRECGVWRGRGDGVRTGQVGLSGSVMQVTLDSSAARIPIYRDALPLASRQVRWPGASSVVPFTARRVD